MIPGDPILCGRDGCYAPCAEDAPYCVVHWAEYLVDLERQVRALEEETDLGELFRRHAVVRS